MDLIIEGDPEILESIYRDIHATLGATVDVETRTDDTQGAYNEPILISIIVALGGPVIVRSIRDIIKRHYEHVEAMRKLDLQDKTLDVSSKLVLKTFDGQKVRGLTLNQLTAEIS